MMARCVSALDTKVIEEDIIYKLPPRSLLTELHVLNPSQRIGQAEELFAKKSMIMEYY